VLTPSSCATLRTESSAVRKVPGTRYFPAMKGNVALLMKDFVLFAASLYLLKQDVARVSQGVEQGDVAAASKSVEAMR